MRTISKTNVPKIQRRVKPKLAVKTRLMPKAKHRLMLTKAKKKPLHKDLQKELTARPKFQPFFDPLTYIRQYLRKQLEAENKAICEALGLDPNMKFKFKPEPETELTESDYKQFLKNPYFLFAGDDQVGDIKEAKSLKGKAIDILRRLKALLIKPRKRKPIDFETMKLLLEMEKKS